MIPLVFVGSNSATAAEETYTLYCYSDGQIVPVHPEIKVKGLFLGRDNMSAQRVYALASDDKVYMAFNCDLQEDSLGNKPSGSYLQPTNTNLIPGHSVRGAADEIMPKSGTESVDLSVDADGKAWIRSNYQPIGTVSPSQYHQVTAPTVVQGTDDIDFHQLTETPDGGTVYYLGSPRQQSSSTTIAQMPTAGAPEGNTWIGLAALGLGLGAVALTRKRRA